MTQAVVLTPEKEEMLAWEMDNFAASLDIHPQREGDWTDEAPHIGPGGGLRPTNGQQGRRTMRCWR